MRLLLEARRLGAEYIIIDTSISPAKEPIVALAFESTEDTRNAVDYGLTGNEQSSDRRAVAVRSARHAGLCRLSGRIFRLAGQCGRRLDRLARLRGASARDGARATAARPRRRRREPTRPVAKMKSLRHLAFQVVSIDQRSHALETSARDLYVDLLVRSVVDGIYGDPMPGPWRPGNKFDRGERAPGTLGPSTAHTMVGVDRLQQPARSRPERRSMTT